MKSRGTFAEVGAAAALCALLLAADVAPGLAAAKKRRSKPKPTPVPDFRIDLPVLGTRLEEFPAAPGKELADLACLQCHSASMATQQTLTEKQWGREVDKMIGWGAAVPADRRDALVAYLAARFGPDNRFEPLVTRPVGK